MPTTAAGSIATVARWVLARFHGRRRIGHFVSADTFLARSPWMLAPEAVAAVSG